MATPNYGYEKRQKELAKKRKKEEKLKRKAEGKPGDSGDTVDSEAAQENSTPPAQPDSGGGRPPGNPATS